MLFSMGVVKTLLHAERVYARVGLPNRLYVDRPGDP